MLKLNIWSKCLQLHQRVNITFYHLISLSLTLVYDIRIKAF